MPVTQAALPTGVLRVHAHALRFRAAPHAGDVIDSRRFTAVARHG